MNRKIKYLLGTLALLILVPIIALMVLFTFFGKDDPPIDDRDLWLSKIEILKEENASYDLNQASQKLYLPKEKMELFREMAAGKKWDSEFAKELVENNREVFDYFERALTHPYFQIPELQDPKTIGFETVIPGMSSVRNISQLNSIKAAYLFTQGKEKEAFDLTIKTIKMGQMMEDSPRPVLISYLVGMAIKETGLQRLRIMIPDTTLSSEILKNYIAELKQFEENEEGLAKALKMEYISLANTKAKITDALFIGGLSEKELKAVGLEEPSIQIKLAAKLKYFYKPNQTQRLFAEYYRQLINNVNKSYYNEMELPEVKPLVPSSKINMLFTENIIGKMIHNIMAIGFSGLFEKKFLEDFSVTGTQSLLAIKAYQIETGEIPISLEVLVSKYISEIPKDPFDGKPIKYSPEKKIIYSVGKDLKDSGGSEGENLREMDDPTFKIEF